MNTVVNRQKGMSFVLIMLIVGLVAFAGLFALKVGPAFLEYQTVTKIAEETAANPEVMAQPRGRVLAHIDKAYRTNNLWDLRADETIVLKKNGRGYTVDVEYEKRLPLFANIHVVTVFTNAAETP